MINEEKRRHSYLENRKISVKCEDTMLKKKYLPEMSGLVVLMDYEVNELAMKNSEAVIRRFSV